MESAVDCIGRAVAPRLLTACSLILVPWIGVLIAQLHGAAGKRSFASSWIGLDVIEFCGMLLSAMLVRRRHRATSPVTAATATVLTADAWFDFMSAAPKLPYAQAMFLACFAELPLAVLLVWASWQSLSWAGPRRQPQLETANGPAASSADSRAVT